MSDATAQAYPRSQEDTRLLAIIVYGLYVFATLSAGLAGIAGVILAYVKRDSAAGTIWAGHFENQIQAFWIWFMVYAVGLLLSPVLIGIPIIAVAFIYFLYRTIRGLVLAVEGQPYV